MDTIMNYEITYSDGRNYEECDAPTLADAESIVAKFADKHFIKGFNLHTYDWGITGDGMTHEYTILIKYPIADDNWREIATIVHQL